jgi:hypothetical protein
MTAIIFIFALANPFICNDTTNEPGWFGDIKSHPPTVLHVDIFTLSINHSNSTSELGKLPYAATPNDVLIGTTTGPVIINNLPVESVADCVFDSNDILGADNNIDDDGDSVDGFE